MRAFIGIDLGGTNIKYALGTESGEILISKIKPTMGDKSMDVIFENMFSAVDELMEEAKKRGDEVAAIGVGSPGCINFDQGQLVGKIANIKSWIDAPIKMKFEERFSIPTWAENDANLVALAEGRVGAGKGYVNILCLTIGTGIGGGILINNQLLRGSNYSAAEVGHIIIEHMGRQCNCGNRGCLEAYTSAPAMVEQYRRKLKRTGVSFSDKNLSTKVIFEKASLNEDLARETILETCDYLGVGIASTANIIDPQAVIIGGGVADAGPEFIQNIELAVKKYALKPVAKNLKVFKATLGNEAGIVGAILLAAENYSK